MAMRHVLIVDDEPAICEVVKLALEADGTRRVTPASTAFDALAALRRDRPHGAIVDALMPKVSGISIASEALALGVPVLLMTGALHLQRAFTAHDIPFIAKPFHIAEMTAATRLLLGEARERHAQLTLQMARLIANVAELRGLVERSRENLDHLRAVREGHRQ
jgi:DNA-binding response OmpR family regulator